MDAPNPKNIRDLKATLEGRKLLRRAIRTRKKFWYKERWFSICSAHYEYNENCTLCKAGEWKNVWMWHISHTFYKLTPKLWRWWMNR